MTRIEWAMNLVRDEHWNALLMELRQAEMDRFAGSDTGDFEAREDAYRRVRIYDELRAHVESLAATQTLKERRWKIL